ncbi:E3 ubiquitin-protein ligase RNF13 isoform X2 [Linepithema humile]|uniref:E3 ubiquitin-protein ligase RNF13 isoform X2 n=1 Tax=Linepithema humile TaxID=83485 RepID=UPI0006232B51|nr:PREDICTED: E3 ubiquitin-protein ligase RNF13-like [Linepithema humile]XP_012218004.1 PREDICTED: E3 ubiquitin-protein ligase RNF13-like [Linepithema humile]XP_012218005.1 PREDICTED: E3 ubiquitin-protein ligase RNF13-like [Linepithema humile]
MGQYCLNYQILLWLIFLILCATYSSADILVFNAVARHQIEEEFRDMPAKFGGIIPPEGIKGVVVYSDPPTACQKIQAPPNNTDYTGNWIALIRRYNCSFEIKVRMAQEAGYDAAIVHNINSNELEPMSAKDPVGILIPAVFVSDITGMVIKENYLYDQLFFILINDDLPFNINTHLLLPFAIVVGICFLIICIFMIIRCIKDRRRQRRHRLPSSSLKKIPTHKYTKGDPYETCAICLDDYVEGEKLRVLPCAHAYHSKCIDPWLTKNRRVCPVCKRKVFASDEQIVTDESDSDADDTTPLIRDGHQGTQGGTFAHQRENPFNRARRSQARQDTSNSSDNSSDSEHSSVTTEDGVSTSAGEPSNVNVFMVSDTHSINGEPQDLEGSANSEKSHVVNSHANAQEFPAPVQIASTRRGRAALNSGISNSDYYVEISDNTSGTANSSNRNDVVT